MDLYYDETLIKKGVKNWKGINRLIVKHLKKINFKSYYQRVWEHEGRVTIDYGSHYNFFFIELKEGEDYNSLVEGIRLLD